MEERRENQRRKRSSGLLSFQRGVSLLLLICVALLAVLGLVTKDRPYSDNENRSLAQRPAITLDTLEDGSFFADYGSYLSDQFFGRDGWITLDTIGARLSGHRDANGVYIGRDGYLFQDPEMPDDETQTRKLNAVNAFARGRSDLNVMFMLVPGSSAILHDKLPKNAPVRDQLADIAAVEAGLDASAIRILDVSAALSAHSDEYIYYRTDHHWTSLGAFYAFASAADVLGAGTGTPAFDVLTVSDSFEGTLASKSGIHSARDSIQVYLPRDTGMSYYVNYTDSQTRVTSLFVSEALESKDQYTVFFGGNFPLLEIWTTADNGRTLLVLKDSYANSFLQFLTTYYEKIIVIDPRYYYGSLGTVLSTYGVTDVLFLYSADTWMTDTTLADALETMS